MKTKNVLPILLVIILSFSCKDPYSQSSVPTCTWTAEENIHVDPIALKVPSGMSPLYMGQVPSDGVFKTLTHPLWPGDFSTSNKAKIFGDLTSDGSACSGDNSRSYDYAYNNSRIGNYYLTLTAPSQGFFGTAKMTIRSDDFKTASNHTIAEYVLWSGSSSNPDYPTIYGSITGVRKTYDPNAGKIIIKDKDGSGCYYKSGQRICP